MPLLDFKWVDVFAEKKFEGNQLAVFPNARSLDSGQMQDIAREMGLSESTFITGTAKTADGKTAYTTRIFTVEEELPFAGHPTLGTAFYLKTEHGSDDVTLMLKVGEIPVKFSNEGGRVFGEMRQNEPEFGLDHNSEDISRIFGVHLEEIDDRYPIQTVSTGNPFAIVPFRHLKTLQELKPNFAMMVDYLEKTDSKFMYAVSTETVDNEAILHARMIFYGGEDPATGSAAGPAAAWMLRHGIMEPERRYFIEQGLEMHRPSRIYVTGSLKDGVPEKIRVGGHCFMAGQGKIIV